MTGEFTAIYEQKEGGVVLASLAELPGIRIRAASLDEARTRLAEKLRRVLKRRCRESLAVVTADAQVEVIRVERPSPQGRPAASEKGGWTKSEMALWQALLAQGRIEAIPPPPVPGQPWQRHEPIPIEGKPLSEEIIEDRR
jgi:predicted RNase H-like HicB family nuclease